MNVPVFLAAVGANPNEAELLFIWRRTTPEGKAIVFCLLIFSIVAWSVMIAKAVQMRRAKKLNRFFDAEYRTQKNVLDVFDRRVQAEGCPTFMVYQAGSLELDARLKNPDGNGRKQFVSLKGMEHVKRSMENAVAQESLKLESGLILLAIAVSGAPFLGLLGTVWVRGAPHHRVWFAGGNPLHVRLQLAGAYPARDDRGTRQFRTGAGVEDGDGIS
jgi:biopolymer transport protein TolQ